MTNQIHPVEDSEDKSSKRLAQDPIAEDAVFGEITEAGPNYRDVGIYTNPQTVANTTQVGWIGTLALMMKTQFGLGILAIPGVLDTLGLIPGVICICVIATMITWSNYVVGTFKLNHPEVYGIDDAGSLMFGRIGREFKVILFSRRTIRGHQCCGCTINVVGQPWSLKEGLRRGNMPRCLLRKLPFLSQLQDLRPNEVAIFLTLIILQIHC